MRRFGWGESSKFDGPTSSKVSREYAWAHHLHQCDELRSRNDLAMHEIALRSNGSW